MFFLISAQIHRYTIYVLSRNMKNIRSFYLKIFIFLMVKFSVYLNRHVFVMGRNRAEMIQVFKTINYIDVDKTVVYHD